LYPPRPEAPRRNSAGPVAADFDAAALRADILDSQRNGQKYRDFTRRAMKAGAQGYFAFLRGKRVTYFGRRGDQRAESAQIGCPFFRPGGI
jgi:uncharacterized protein YbcV (DUF1398 family)